MKKFIVEDATNGCIEWIKNWIDNNCPEHKIVIGLSGGKDSTIVATLCVKAVGAENVIGVAIPGTGQGLNDADKIAMSAQTKMNIPPRLRMTTLYAVAQSCKGVVVNTCNLSEDYIGYSTLFGDCAGSFAPVRNLTATEIIAIGDYLGLPHEWVHKTPDDGLPGSSPDEQKFGFTYKTLDDYIRGYAMPDEEIQAKIEERHFSNMFKLEIVQIPAYDYYGENDEIINVVV